MDDERPYKRVSESRIELAMMMNQQHANLLGNVHGGTIMKLADETGGMAAIRHANGPAVTKYIDSISFDEPVHVGEMLRVCAELTWVGNTSMEVLVVVEAENILTSNRIETNRGYFVYVAIDRFGRPRPVPGLTCETPEQEARFHAAEARRAQRLASAPSR